MSNSIPSRTRGRLTLSLLISPTTCTTSRDTFHDRKKRRRRKGLECCEKQLLYVDRITRWRGKMRCSPTCRSSFHFRLCVSLFFFRQSVTQEEVTLRRKKQCVASFFTEGFPQRMRHECSFSCYVKLSLVVEDASRVHERRQPTACTGAFFPALLTGRGHEDRGRVLQCVPY